MGGVVSKWLSGVFKIWNIIIKATFNVLMKLPDDLNAGAATVLKDVTKTEDLGGVSSILYGVNNIFVGVATSLLVLFFVIGFCQETVDVKEEMRYDNIVKYLIRLCVAEYFTINSKTILTSVLVCCSKFVKVLKSYWNKDMKTKAELHITESDKDILKNCKFWEGILILVVAIVVGFLLIAMAAMIWYAAWSRMLNLLILIPFGSLAFATMGGAGEVGRICSTYMKKFIAVALESVVIAVALIFGTALMSEVGLNFLGKGWLSVVGHLLSMLLQAGILTGTVKSAEYLMKDMIG